MKFSYLFGIFLFFSFCSFQLLANENKLNEIPQQLLLKIGKEVYFSKSSDSCAKCHGDITSLDTSNKDMEESADLKDPTTWVVYKALGGELKKNEDPNKFQKNFNNIVIDLITFGASDWNRNFYVNASKDYGFSWNRVEGKQQYDTQMKGIKIGIAKNILKKIDRILRKEGYKISRNKLENMAAISVYRYVENQFK